MIDPQPPQIKKEPKCRFEHDYVYSFTFNPKDKYQWYQEPKELVSEEIRLEKFKNKLSVAMKFLQDNQIKYFCNIECTVPFQGVELRPRLHLHGIIQFKDVKAKRWFLLYGIPYITMIGQMEIDTIDDLDYWSKYCNKQQYMELGYLTNQLIYTSLDEYITYECVCECSEELIE